MVCGFLFLLAIAYPITSSPVPQVCHDLVNGVDREYLLEEVNECYECGWHALTRVTRTSNVFSLNGPENSALINPEGAWCSNGEEDAYLEIGIGTLEKLGGIKIQGYFEEDSWVTSFQVMYRNYDGDFMSLRDSEGNTQIFMGNNDATTIEEKKFTIPIEASAVRILPVTYHTAACIRVDLHSCSPETSQVASDAVPNSAQCQVNVLECDPPCIKYKEDVNGCNTCDCAEVSLGETFESDIVITEQTKASIQATLVTKDFLNSGNPHGAGRYVARWTDYKNGKYYEVPYTLSSRFDSSARGNIQRAIDAIASQTCIKLVPRSNQRHYISFVRGGGCSSPVGKQSSPNRVTLGYGCEHPGTVIHEVMHSLGFWHEQSRPDRDSYVRIQLQNIPPNMRYNFQKQRVGAIDSLGSPYDISSVMHYGSRAFSINGYPTIVDLRGQPLRTQRSGMSKEDIIQINRMYKCSGGGGGVVTVRPTTTIKTTKPPTTCTDGNRHCSYWSGIGECQKNPDYMLKNCKKSCRVCGGGSNCVDKHRSCPAWKVYYCRPGNKYYTYMKLNCKKSCNLC